MLTLSTARLDALPLGPGDYEAMRSLHADPTASATLSPDGRPLPEQRTRAALQRMEDRWLLDNIGPWSFRLRTDLLRDGVAVARAGDWVGYAGIRRADDPLRGEGELWELMYGIRPLFWRGGFGTEMAEAALKDGRERLGIAEVWAWTLWTNRASRGLMRRLGFRQVGGAIYAGLPHVVTRAELEPSD